MTGSVITRIGTSIIGDTLVHDDQPTSWEEADKLVGHRVDRRAAYAIIDGGLNVSCRWSDACTGCAEFPEQMIGPERGGGCHECGYTGRVRHAAWVPYWLKSSVADDIQKGSKP